MTPSPADSLLAWLWHSLLKKQAISILFISLQWVSLANLNAVLSESIPDIEPFQFGFLILFGLVSSWVVVSKYKQRSGLALLLLLLEITLITPLLVGNSYSIILSTLIEATQSDWQQVNVLARLLLSSYVTYFSEIRTWFTGVYLLAGEAPPAAVNAIWSALLACLTIWISWWQIRRANPIVALLPIGLILSVILSYSGGNPLFLSVFLAAFIILVGVSNYTHQEQRWDQQGTDYSYEIRYDVGAFVTATTLFVLGSAYLFSAVPVSGFSRIAGELYNLTNQTITGVATSLGLQKSASPRDISAFAGSGLPRSHLLGMDPTLSTRLALQISLDRTPPPAFPLYWRALAFDFYTGYGWESSPTSKMDSGASSSIATALTSSPESIEGKNPYYFLQTVTKFDQSNRLLFGLGEPVTIDAPAQLSVRQPGDLYGATIQSSKYRLISSVVFPDRTTLINTPAEYPEWVEDRYLQLPETIPERVRSLGAELTADHESPFAKAEAIETHLRTIPYSLNLPAPPDGQEITDFFLFEAKMGYCDYYATAMVVLLRSVGIPSRLVMGYAQGVFDAEKSHYLVSESDAHSWVEVFFPTIGWVLFEPTSGSPAVVRSEHSTAADAELALPPSLPWLSNLTYWFRSSPAWIIVTVVIVALLMAFACLRGSLKKILNLILFPDRRVGTIYDWMIRSGQRLGISRSVSTTPNELAQSLLLRSRALLQFSDRELLEKYARLVWIIINTYNQQTYSRHLLARQMVNAAVRAWLCLQPLLLQFWFKHRLKMLQSAVKKNIHKIQP